MAERRVSVRMSATGGDRVKADLRGVGTAGEQGFERMTREVREARTSLAAFAAQGRVANQNTVALSRQVRSAGGTSQRFTSQVQNAAFQVGDFAVQVGAGTSATRALAQQLPQLLGGFGVLGAVVGAAVAILVPLGASLFSAGDAAEDAADGIDTMSVSLEGIRGGIKQLGDLQEDLNALLVAQASASATGSAALLANTQKEFDARKQLLGVEVEILNIRSQEQRQAIQNLRDQNAAIADSIRREIANTSALSAQQIGLSDIAGLPGAPRIGPDPGRVLAPFGESVEGLNERALQIRKLQAELALLEIAADEGAAALDGVFSGGEVVGADGDGGGGGRGGGRSRTAKEIEEVRKELETTLISTEELQQSLGRAFSSIVTGAQSAEKALQGLLAQFAEVLANRAFASLFDGLFSGLGGRGGFLGGLFGSFEGGGYTGAGARAGGMDGRGGFLAMLHPNETVIDHTRGGGGVVITNNVSVDARGADADAAARIEGAMMQTVNLSVAATLEAIRRGRGR